MTPYPQVTRHKHTSWGVSRQCGICASDARNVDKQRAMIRNRQPWRAALIDAQGGVVGEDVVELIAWFIGRERRRFPERSQTGPAAGCRRRHVEVAHEHSRSGEAPQIARRGCEVEPGSSRARTTGECSRRSTARPGYRGARSWPRGVLRGRRGPSSGRADTSETSSVCGAAAPPASCRPGIATAARCRTRRCPVVRHRWRPSTSLPAYRRWPRRIGG